PALFTAQDSIVLRGLENGVPQRTSSVETFFIRNSANNPFYPTKGSKLSLDVEAAGGPWGGSVNFHKERLEGRLYFPSLFHGITGFDYGYGFNRPAVGDSPRWVAHFLIGQATF